MQESGLGHRTCLSPAPQNCFSQNNWHKTCVGVYLYLFFFLMRLILVSRETTLYKALKVSNYAS